MVEAIRIVLVDDHPLWREGVASTLEAEPDLQVVAQGATASEAVDLAQNHLPEVLLLDIALPGGGLSVVETIAKLCPATKIVMLTFSEEEAEVLRALQAGARGYVLKGVTGRELKSIIRSVQAGEVYITPLLASGMLLELASRTSHPDPLGELTPREREILEGVASGLSNKEIGWRLQLTEKTVKHYMTNVLQKLQLRNRVEAAVLMQKVHKP